MRKSLSDIQHMVSPIPYPGQLPDELKPYHYYIADNGHSIMCILECHLEEAKDDMDSFEIPIPVKYVLEKGYRKQGDYIIIDAPYDPDLGVMIDDKYREYVSELIDDLTKLRHLEVGQLFELGRTHFDEMIKFEFEQSGPVLFIVWNRPTEKEIEAVRTGKFYTKFYEYDNVIFMLFKFGSVNWIDAPYSIHLSEPFKFEEMGETQGFGLQVFLVDAATGILKAMRLIGLGHDFSLRLQAAMEKQKDAEFSQETYNFKINEIYRRYTTDQLAEFARWYYRTEK